MISPDISLGIVITALIVGILIGAAIIYNARTRKKKRRS